jgi:hypothetical protein
LKFAAPQAKAHAETEAETVGRGVEHTTGVRDAQDYR